MSSEVENIVTTNDALYGSLNRDEWESHPHVKEVLRYSDALWYGMKHLNQNRIFTPNFFSRLASIIKSQEIDIRDLSGTRISNPNSGEIIYSPPESEPLLRSLLDNLCDFYYSQDELDPLVKMAVAHYQFEAIHPFRDGNGRTGRVLNVLWLVHERLLELPVLYLSKGILENRVGYYEGLRRVYRGRSLGRMDFIHVNVVRRTADDTRNRIERIEEARSQCIEKVRTLLPKIYSRELIDVIFSQPYTRISSLEKADIVARQAASRHLKALESIGVLSSAKFGRDVLFLNRELMNILSA